MQPSDIEYLCAYRCDICGELYPNDEKPEMYDMRFPVTDWARYCDRCSPPSADRI